MFVTAMRRKWQSLVYLDLFSGPGRAKIEGTKRIVATSPFVVLQLDEKFDRYIFCDQNVANYKALQTRVSRDFPKMDIRVIPGDVNEETERILKEMPVPHKNNKVLGFCFLDPYKIANLKFSTIKTLSSRYMDFLILIPSGMDVNRNEASYLGNDTLDLYLGNSTWRVRWQTAKIKNVSFGNFVIEEFSLSMISLGFEWLGLEKTVPVKNDKNVIVYRLAYYSKHPLGLKFWNESRIYTDAQKDMFDT
jgi:three-Cys-motif partner protein